MWFREIEGQLWRVTPQGAFTNFSQLPARDPAATILSYFVDPDGKDLLGVESDGNEPVSIKYGAVNASGRDLSRSWSSRGLAQRKFTPM